MDTVKSNKPLSDRAIRTHKPNGGTLVDTGEYRGLRVEFGKSGRKTFTYRYRSPYDQKKLVQIKIGSYPQTSLEQARLELKRLKALRDSGMCPKREIEKQKLIARKIAESEQFSSVTVKNLIDKYLTDYIENKVNEGRGSRTPKGQREARRALYKDVVEPLGTVSAIDVSRKDVTDLVLGITKRGANVQAGYVLRELTAAFRYAISIGYLPYDHVNPAIQAKDGLQLSRIKLTCKARERYFSDDELVKFLHWLPESGFSKKQKSVLRLTLWTGCRTGEICALVWEDVDFEKGTLFLRETKTGISRNVMLPTQALNWFHNEYQHRRSETFVFCSQRTGRAIQQKQLTEKAWSLRQKGTMLDVPEWTPHDLRRTVRTGLARIKCPSEVAEAVLGHTKKGILKNYDLHTYEDDCRLWLQKWADYQDELFKTSGIENVNGG